MAGALGMLIAEYSWRCSPTSQNMLRHAHLLKTPTTPKLCEKKLPTRRSHPKTSVPLCERKTTAPAVPTLCASAYVQYVRFKGKDRAGEIMNEYKFSGNLCEILYRLDTFVDTTIANRKPVPVSALREKTIIDYPHWATRELLMNAICHRDYESNGPVQFYQYDDRFELLNPGGLLWQGYS